MIEFFCACVPPKTTHHSKRIVKVSGFSKMADSDKLNDAKGLLDSLIIAHRPQSPILGPVRLTLTFVWPFRKSEPKKNQTGLMPHTTKPDCSNLAKTLEDRLAAFRFIENDATVSELNVRKFYGPQPGIKVRIETIGAVT